MKNRAFIISISNKHTLPAFKDILNDVRDTISPISSILESVTWSAPKEYEIESGVGLDTRILILQNPLTIDSLVALKKFLTSIEYSTSVNDRRTFNLNPGYLDDTGLYLLSHKPNFLRGREYVGGDVWSEKQYEVSNGYFQATTNTFSELLDKSRIGYFQDEFTPDRVKLPVTRA